MKSISATVSDVLRVTVNKEGNNLMRFKINDIHLFHSLFIVKIYEHIVV